MNIMATFFFLLTLAFCLSLQPQLIAAKAFYTSETVLNNPKLVEQACSRARDKNFCASIINSDKSDGPKRNLKDLAFIALKNAAKTTTETSSYIQGIADDEGLSGATQQALTDCKEHYIAAADLIEDAIEKLVTDSYKEVLKFGKAALDDIHECNAGVKDQHKVAAQKSLSAHHMLDTALSVTIAASAGATAH